MLPYWYLNIYGVPTAHLPTSENAKPWDLNDFLGKTGRFSSKIMSNFSNGKQRGGVKNAKPSANILENISLLLKAMKTTSLWTKKEKRTAHKWTKP